jgi:hypothetical protein
MAAMSPDASMLAMVDEMSSSAATDEMPSDMPCCPSKAPAPAPLGCDKCLFMANCMSIGFTALQSTVVQPLLTASDDIALLKNASGPDGLGHPPPEHPPRILV